MRRSPSRPGQDRHREDGLRLLPVGLLDVPAEQQVELLVGAPQLDVRLDRDGVVALQSPDRAAPAARSGARCSIRCGKSSRSITRATVTCRSRRSRSSIGMSSHSLLRRTSVRSRSSTLKAWSWNVCGVAVDLLRLEHRPQHRLPGRIADPGGEVPDDQDHRVAGVLELAQLLQDDHVAEVDVRARSGRCPSFARSGRPSPPRPAELVARARPRAASRPRFAPGRRPSRAVSSVRVGHGAQC